MLNRLAYSHYGDRYEPNATDDLREFLREARRELEVEGKVYATMEPGDGTRYEFLYFELDRHVDVLAYLSESRSFVLKLGRGGFTVPGYLESHAGKGVNPCTAAVACDFANWLRNPDCPHQFLDWEGNRRPVPERWA